MTLQSDSPETLQPKAGIRNWLAGVVAALLLVGFLYFQLPSAPVIVPPEVIAGLVTGNGPNLVLDRESLTPPVWGLENVVITPNAGLAPDGSNTAIRISETNETGRHRFETAVTMTSGGVYTLSVYAKKQERKVIQFEMRDLHPGSYSLVRFDMEGVSTFGNVGALVAAGVQELPTGWVRCWAALRYATNTADFNIALSDIVGATQYVGDPSSGLLVWGLQFEPGDRPKGYSSGGDQNTGK